MKKIMIIVLLLAGTTTFAQQDMLFTQYMFHKMSFNPAYAGGSERFSMDLISRFQWVGITGAPKTISFTASTPLRNPHVAVGLYAYMDKLGPEVDYSLMGDFTYRIIFPTSKLCFGVEAGFKYKDIDWAELNPKDQGDIELASQVKNKAVPDVDFGIYYYGPRFYVGLSSKHLLQNNVVITSTPVPDGVNSFTKLMRHFYAMGGFVFPVSDNFVITPSVLCKYAVNTPFQADFNVNFTILKVLTLGATVRTHNAMGFIAGINITKGLSVGYSYDIWYNALKAYNSGSHEIRIGYDVDLFVRNRMLTPRYF